MPEVCILLSLFDFSDSFYPIVFDEAGMFSLESSQALVIKPTNPAFVQATASQRNTSSPHSMAPSRPSISSTTVPPTPSSRDTPSSGSPPA